ncbi:MAG: NAD-dependent L-serine dehydrogenase [Pseudomonas citronellolis]|nr:MAG: NAD-dependent L-serine dehydrogenase [Pseudomonas citronellolis]
MKQIAFIGLGNMGAPMAANLLKAGYLLRVFDLLQGAMDALVPLGANAARSAHDAVQGADLVISMLPASHHVEGLYLGSEGLLAHIDPGTLVLECSTIAPASARKVHQAAQAAHIPMLDAPVSGGVGGAIAGTLTFMVGGEAETLEQARPVFASMGRNIFHAGGPGAGQVAKVCNNQLLAVLMIGTAEALALGAANGLDPAVLSEIMRRSSGGNWALEVYNPWPGLMESAPAARGYSGGFMTALMTKDLGLAQETAQVSGNATPMGSLALSLYRLLVKQGYADKDFSVVQKLFES